MFLKQTAMYLNLASFQHELIEFISIFLNIKAYIFV